MGTEDIITLFTQIGVVPALFAYTLIKVNKTLENNTKVMTQILTKLGGDDIE